METSNIMVETAYVLQGFLTAIGTDCYMVLKKCLNSEQQIAAEKPEFDVEVLYGNDYKNCGIVPGNTNKFLLSRGEYRPSKYVSYAFHKATKYHLDICGASKIEETDHNDSIMELSKYKNSLILGGPVANEYTKRICGY